ncbi:helix-turn-helix domain-containing protein, partial [Halobaculum sp. EA56]|uniref:helix-turn-helix domain-containing protein n=1 Tax=Halobaculum sp. EA56 TaxID=3421648 RepID=UPI003EBA76DA
MAVVARLSVPAAEFELGAALVGVEYVEVELERVIPTGPEFVPFFWVRGASVEAVDAALAEADAIEDAEFVDRAGDSLLYRCRCGRDDASVVTGMERAGLTLLSASGRGGRWTFDVRGDGWETVGAFREFCAANGIDVRLESMGPLESVGDDADDRLTDAQAEALVAAYEAGYYDSPRRATLAEIADDLGISRQSLAERLKRG